MAIAQINRSRRKFANRIAMTMGLGIALAIAAPAMADLAKDKADCFTKQFTVPERTQACARVLETPDLTPEEKAEALYRHALGLYSDKKYAEALDRFKQAVTVKPDNGDYLSGLASAYRAKADFRQCIATYGKAIEVRPDRPRTYFLRGECHYRAEDFTSAIADFDKTQELKPNDTESLFLRGHAYAKANKPDRAVEDFSRLIGISRFHAAAHVSRAQLYEKLGDTARAIRDYRIALLLDPNWDQADEGVLRLAPTATLATPAEPIVHKTPAAKVVFSFIQVEAKDVPPKDDMEKAIADLAGWFNRPPLPTARRGSFFDLTVGPAESGDIFVTTSRVAAFPAINTPAEQKLALYRSIWPHVWPGPGNQRMVIAYDAAALDGLWPLKPGATAQGEAKVFVPKCPPGEDAARAALACPADQRADLGVARWKAGVLRWEQVVVPAGRFDAMVIRHEEEVELSFMGMNAKRKTVAHFWYAPALNWWVRRTTQADGQIATVELVEAKQ